MHFLDIMILCCVIGWGVLGFFRGLLSQLSLILAFAISILCNMLVGGWIRLQISQWFEQEWIGWVAAYILSFLLSLMVIKIIAAILKGFLGDDGAKNIDRLFGGLFGGIKGILLAMFLVFCLEMFARPDAFAQSLFAPYARGGANWLADSLIDRERMAKMAEELSERIRSNENIQGLGQGKEFLDRLKDSSDAIDRLTPQKSEEPQTADE